MKSYTSRYRRAPFTIEIDGATVQVQPVLGNDDKRTANRFFRDITQKRNDVIGHATQRAIEVRDDPDAWEALQDEVAEGEEELRQLVIEGCCVYATPEFRDVMRAAMQPVDDITCYEIYGDIRGTVQMNTDRLTEERPT